MEIYIKETVTVISSNFHLQLYPVNLYLSNDEKDIIVI